VDEAVPESMIGGVELAVPASTTGGVLDAAVVSVGGVLVLAEVELPTVSGVELAALG
jgi:hypothetical protein